MKDKKFLVPVIIKPHTKIKKTKMHAVPTSTGTSKASIGTAALKFTSFHAFHAYIHYTNSYPTSTY